MLFFHAIIFLYYAPNIFRYFFFIWSISFLALVSVQISLDLIKSFNLNSAPIGANTATTIKRIYYGIILRRLETRHSWIQTHSIEREKKKKKNREHLHTHSKNMNFPKVPRYFFIRFPNKHKMYITSDARSFIIGTLA